MRACRSWRRYSFASTGAVQYYDRLRDELLDGYERLPEWVRDWVDVLGTYALHTGERGPMEGWADL